MLSLNQTFDDTRSIKVFMILLFTINKVQLIMMQCVWCRFWLSQLATIIILIVTTRFLSSTNMVMLMKPLLFNYQAISQLREVPFYELNWPQSGNSNSKASILRHINWHNGSLRFEYLRYDRVLLGPGDLDNFQVSSIVDCQFLQLIYLLFRVHGEY